jgi:hypothetical protein
MKPTVSQAIKQYAPMLNLALVVWVFIGPVGNITARSHRMKDRPVIRVGIYNYAKIKRSELRQAETLAAALFYTAGVRIVWLECLHKAVSFRSLSDDPAPDFSVRILRDSKSARARRASGVDVMGESIIPSGVDGPVAGGIANIFYEQVKEVTSAWGQYTSAVLGEAIAHELGHLMLGPQHSRRGIMKILWTPRDQALITRCELRFLPGQAVELQRAARSLQQDSSPMLVAQR